MPDLTWVNETWEAPAVGDEPREYMSLVYPNDDLAEHVPESIDCICGPVYRIIIGIHTDKPGELCLCTLSEIVHNSLDGRELSE